MLTKVVNPSGEGTVILSFTGSADEQGRSLGSSWSIILGYRNQVEGR